MDTGPGIGRRVSSDLYPGKVGTVVKIRQPGGADLYPTYDVAFDDASGVERIAHALITGPSWRMLGERVTPKIAEDRRLAYLEAKLRERVELARQRMAGQSSAPAKPSGASFYRPSDTFINASDVIRMASAPNEAKRAAKALREVLAHELEGVRAHVQTKADVVHVSWVDGPVGISRLTDRFTAGRAGADVGPVAGRITVCREISDLLVECAIEFVRQTIGEPLDGVSAHHFREGSLRDVYPRSGACSGLSIGRLVRVVLMRWDDHDQRFVTEGLTRGMVLENEALYPEKDLVSANSRMRLIRRAAGELNIESAAMEDAAQVLDRQKG